jgi:nicotinate phosphoribosyltransferase
MNTQATENAIANQPLKTAVSENALPQIALPLNERVEALKLKLPESFEPYSDKYFLRTHEILSQEGLNPWVRAQVFIRTGPGEVRGVDEAIAVIDKYSDFRANGGKIFALSEGSSYGPKETLMVIEGRMLDIIALETIYLGVLSAETTKVNEGISEVDLDAARERMRQVVDLAGDRPVSYFGARHWRYDADAAIALAAFEGGATGASTDVGAAMGGKVGQGTIPHALENIYAWINGKENAVVEATLAFDRVIDPQVPRIALIDYNNREIDDSIAVVKALQGRLAGVRVDTCGENIAQGALASADDAQAQKWKDKGIPLPAADSPEARYWYGRGVTVTGVYALRQALDAAGFSELPIILTSGFGDPKKVEAFVEAEKVLGVRLFDGLGVGGIYKPCRMATMDIVAVGETAAEMTSISKVGRPYRPNERLELLIDGALTKN